MARFTVDDKLRDEIMRAEAVEAEKRMFQKVKLAPGSEVESTPTRHEQFARLVNGLFELWVERFGLQDEVDDDENGYFTRQISDIVYVLFGVHPYGMSLTSHYGFGNITDGPSIELKDRKVELSLTLPWGVHFCWTLDASVKMSCTVDAEKGEHDSKVQAS